MPSHWPGNFSSTSFGGISPSFWPCRITSVVCFKHARDLVQPGNVILVVLHRIEAAR